MADLVADSQGVVTGKFTIPANVPAGAKAVQALGGAGQAGVATFTGRGEITTQERRQVTTIQQTFDSRGGNADPLAQTFTLAESRHIAGVDLWFANAGNADVIIQLRNTIAGFPGAQVLAEKRIKTGVIQPSGTPTRVLFGSPVWLDMAREYAIVILTNSATTAMHVAELGKFDSAAQKWITSQAYQVGVLLSSSNAKTWTAHQDRDLTFRLLACKFSATTRSVALGNATVSNTSDLLAALSIDIPATGATAEIKATAPSGEVFRMGPGRNIALPSRITGDIALSVEMVGTDKASPVLFPGMQFVAGDQQASGIYVSRAFPAGTSSRIAITFEAYVPGASAVQVEIQKSDLSWQTLTLTSGVNVGDGWVERSYILTGFTATQTRVRLTLTGSAAARPRVRKLRAVATD